MPSTIVLNALSIFWSIPAFVKTVATEPISFFNASLKSSKDISKAISDLLIHFYLLLLLYLAF